MKLFKRKKLYARFLVKGGVTSPGYLLQIIKAARELGNKYLHFGSRQDILLSINHNDTKVVENNIKQLDLKVIFKNIDAQNEQNIVSSYVACDILPSTFWVTSGTYLRVLDSFEYTPKLKVNIVDPKQNLVPIFYGALNFIASNKEHYWYLYIKNDKNGDNQLWPVLIYSNDIHLLTIALEGMIVDNPNYQIVELFKNISDVLQLNNANIMEELNYSNNFFPEYEGIYKMQSGNRYWAGFYWRNNYYTTEFLEEVCKLCLKTNVSKICLTPWKTFLIKDISENDIIQWEHLIGKFGINMRHSSFELNWHLPLLDKSALNLKKYIVKSFDKVDVRTFGLSFTISKKNNTPMTSIVVKDNGPFSGPFLSFFNTYDILYSKDFNSNANARTTAIINCRKNKVPKILMDLCKQYYAKLISTAPSDKITAESKKLTTFAKPVYQCKSCFTIYDEELGDHFVGIKAHTPFKQLPDDYQCYTCGNSKSEFVQITLEVPSLL